jgi:hypothetical protein
MISPELFVKQGYMIQSWSKEDISNLYTKLELPNWAPWLAASIDTLSGRAEIFPEGQLVTKTPSGELVASLSMNQIYWNGNIDTLPSWDDVAGDPTDYSKTYVKKGNTLVLMSMNVAPDFQGQRLPGNLVEQAKLLVKKVGANFLIGSFRPSGFGTAKKGMGYDPDFDFEFYCNLRQKESGKPVDPWLRSLSWMGMQLLKIDHQAMTVPVSLADFEYFKTTYQPEMWKEIELGIWECGEVGRWQVYANRGMAIYQESNVWGYIPIN